MNRAFNILCEAAEYVSQTDELLETTEADEIPKSNNRVTKTRVVMNAREKVRRAVLSRDLKILNEVLPPNPNNHTSSTLGILHRAIRHITYLQETENKLCQELETLANNKIKLNSRFQQLQKEINILRDHWDFKEKPKEVEPECTCETSELGVPKENNVNKSDEKQCLIPLPVQKPSLIKLESPKDPDGPVDLSNKKQPSPEPARKPAPRSLTAFPATLLTPITHNSTCVCLNMILERYVGHPAVLVLKPHNTNKSS